MIAIRIPEFAEANSHLLQALPNSTVHPDIVITKINHSILRAHGLSGSAQALYDARKIRC